MRAWLVDQFGEPEQMRFAEVPSPEPKAGEVRIQVKAAALNFFDILMVQGKYQTKPAFPFTPGAEAAGVVDRIGEGVTGIRPGDAVMAVPQIGCFAETVISRAARVLPMPAGMDFVEAAAAPIVYHTSWFALVDRANLQEGEWLLALAGASGTGMSAIQIGKALGAKVIAAASTDAKLEFCRTLGADHVLNYTDPAWPDQVKRITGRGADVVYDPVGGDAFDLSTKCIAPAGRLLVIGFASGRIPSIAANRILLKNIAVMGAYWGGWCENDSGYFGRTHQKLAPLFETGKLRPVVSSRLPMAELPRALRELAGRGAVGKAVVETQNT